MKSLFVFAGCLLGGLALQSIAWAGAKRLPAAEAWSVRCYPFPVDLMLSSVVPKGDPLPAMPGESGSPDEIQNFLRKSHEVAKRSFYNSGVVLEWPKGSLSAYDPDAQIMAVRTTNLVQDQIGLFCSPLGKRPSNLAFHEHIVELDGALLESLMKETTATEHQDLWERMQARINLGQAREISYQHLETRSGQAAIISQGQKHNLDTALTLDEHDRVTVTSDKRNVGTTLKMEPTLGPDGRTVDIVFQLNHDFAPPTDRWATTAWTGSQRLESRLTDFHGAEISGATTTSSGMTRLLGVWQPEKKAALRQAAFLTAEVASLEAPLNDRVAKLLEQYGEKVLPTPQVQTAKSSADIMETRRYQVPVDFLTEQPLARPPPDPFANVGKAPPAKDGVTARTILEEAGIPFPEGSEAIFNATLSQISVRNFPGNLEKADAFMASFHTHSYPVIMLSLHVVQADAGLLRGLDAQPGKFRDQTAAWSAIMEAVAQGHAKILDSAQVETRSGQRANVTSGTAYDRLVQPKPDAAPAEKDKAPDPSRFSFTHEATQVGLSFEAEPVLSPEGRLIDLVYSFSYDYAPPIPRPDPSEPAEKTRRLSNTAIDFHKASLVSSVALDPGVIHLLGIWKPEGAPDLQSADLLQAAFLKAEVLMIETDE